MKKRPLKIERNPLYYSLFDLHFDKAVIKDLNMEEVKSVKDLLELALSGRPFDFASPYRKTHRRKTND